MGRAIGLARENLGCGGASKYLIYRFLEMECMSDIKRNRQCTNLLDCMGVYSMFPRIAIRQTLVDKDLNKLLLASSSPLRHQHCGTVS